jgi:hypothetical protein
LELRRRGTGEREKRLDHRPGISKSGEKEGPYVWQDLSRGDANAQQTSPKERVREHSILL